MDKKVEQKLRLKVRRLIESILDEETPMPPPADDFNPAVQKPQKPVRIGGLTVNMSNNTHLTIKSGNQFILVKVDDAVKLANYLIRVLGKV